MKKREPSKGFTLIELLVVVLVTAILSGLAITYSKVGQNQVSLSIEASKISELILQAKQLAISTYSQNSTTCAYGVHFDFTNQTYSLFAYDSATSTGVSNQIYCPTLASTTARGVDLSAMVKYGGGQTWQIRVPRGLILSSVSPTNANNVLTDVLFFPPGPITIMSLDDTTFATSTPTSRVYLQTSDGKNNTSISVSPAGQVGY